MTRLMLLLPVLLTPALLPAQPKKDAPRVLVALPFGVAPGKPARLTLRGLKLDTAKEVRVAPAGSVQLRSKGTVSVPNQQELSHLGDTQIEVELTVPAGATGEAVEVVVVTPAGSSAPHRVLLDRAVLVEEKEPNDGFKQAQPVRPGQTVAGGIARTQDVDVYRFEGKAGQKVVVEVAAARHGSALDAYLSLHDESGRVLTVSDDDAGSQDARVEITLPHSGAYLVSVADAHDQGGPSHLYRIHFRVR